MCAEVDGVVFSYSDTGIKSLESMARGHSTLLLAYICRSILSSGKMSPEVVKCRHTDFFISTWQAHIFKTDFKVYKPYSYIY